MRVKPEQPEVEEVAEVEEAEEDEEETKEEESPKKDLMIGNRQGFKKVISQM